MHADAVRPRIEHELAELRGLYPALEACQASLEQWAEPGGARYSLRLEMRAPQIQLIVSGPAAPDPEAAVAAAARLARERLAALPPS
jgi:hypothetical protein